VIRHFIAGALAASVAFAAPAFAQQQKLRIGFITTMSGPQGVIGGYMRDSVELALDHLGRKVGGMDVEVIYGDDQTKPDVGVQVAEEMLKKHQVDFVSGIIWSNVMLAVAPSVTGAGTFMIGTNAGPHDLAGLHELVPQERIVHLAAILSATRENGTTSMRSCKRRCVESRAPARMRCWSRA